MGKVMSVLGTVGGGEVRPAGRAIVEDLIIVCGLELIGEVVSTLAMFTQLRAVNVPARLEICDADCVLEQ